MNAPGTGVLAFFGLAWETATPRTGSAPQALARSAVSPPPMPEALADSPSTAPVRRQPRALGEPILQADADDRLGSAWWTTQPRMSADGGTIGPLTVRAASICGRRHARRGETCEDAFAVVHCTDGTVIAAVADGLGDPAARYAAAGARIASLLSCQLVGHLVENRRQVNAHAVAAQVAEEMIPQARRLVPGAYDGTDLATTLVLGWVTPQGAYRGFMIGDGGVLILAAGQAAAVAAARGGSFTHTDALPGGHVRLEEFAGRLEPGSALMLATDGLAVPMFSPDVASVLARAWERPPSLLDFLHDMSFERRGEADDRTGVGIWFGPRGVDR